MSPFEFITAVTAITAAVCFVAADYTPLRPFRSRHPTATYSLRRDTRPLRRRSP